MSSLPGPLTRFVGRETELAEVTALLAEARLLTLTGPGGAGKTRLALRLATEVAARFAHGVWFVDFSPLSGGEFLWDQVAATLGVRQPGRGGTLPEAVGRRLAGRTALLVLDNCEHVAEPASEVTAELLAAAPALKVVATSREPLGVGGEVTWAVPPLTEDDAAQLFTDRARLARPKLKLLKEDAAAVLSICRRLDGLPLAIELAAAQTRALAPSRIAADLQDHFRLLPRGPRTAPGRQATLQASFEWSYEMLPEPERTLLRHLSVFAGGFDVDAALAVCPAASLQLLAALAGRSLIAVEERSGQSEPRYRMLETIREFAGARLAEAGEFELVRTRHRDHYLRLAEIAEPLLTSPHDARAQALLAPEHENLRAAMTWSRDHDEPEALARLVVPLGWYWILTNRFLELQRWLEAADGAGEVPPYPRARLAFYHALLAVFTGERLGEVPALVNESLAQARAVGDKRAEALALVILGVVAGLFGGTEAMRPYVEQAVPVARSAGFAYGEVMALEFFVVLRMFQSNPEEISRLADEAVALAEAGVARHTQLTNRSFRGLVAFTRGRLAEAHQIFSAVVSDGREMLDFNYLHSLIHRGLVELFRGDVATARRSVAESLAAAERSEDEGRSAAGVGLHSKFVLGWIELASGDAAHARDSIAAVADATRSSLLRGFAALPLVILAEAQLALGSLEEAAANLEEATSFAERGKQTWLLGRARLGRARLRARRGDLQEAETLGHEALGLAREAGDQVGVVDGLELLARLAAELDSSKEAVRLWAAADSLRTELGYARFPIDQAPHEAAVSNMKQVLGPDEFAAAWAEGAKLSLNDAIAYAARGRGERKRPSTGWASLTPSELEVVRLVGQHLTNPEIASRLFVSRATVKTHLVHIFSKLGIDSRSELVAEGIRRGIQPQPSRRN